MTNFKILIGSKLVKIVYGEDGFDLYFSNGFVIETYWAPRLLLLLEKTIAGEDNDKLKEELEYNNDKMRRKVLSDVQKLGEFIGKKIIWISEKTNCIIKLYFEDNSSFCISDEYAYVLRAIYPDEKSV